VKQANITFTLWTKNDYLCKNFILNGLRDNLYDLYGIYDTAKHVWEALQNKYDTQEVGSKKKFVNRYMNYKMMVTKLWKNNLKNFKK